jgi:hypothetical protein
MPQLLWGDNRYRERQRLSANTRALRNLRLRNRLSSYHVLTSHYAEDHKTASAERLQFVERLCAGRPCGKN